MRHCQPYTGPNSPSSKSIRPTLSKYLRDELPFQILTFLSLSSLASVEPLRNHNNSSTMPLKNTFLVVINGNDDEILSNLIIHPNCENTLPFLVFLYSPFKVSFNRLI